MPRETGGRSPLGAMINKIGSDQDGNRINKSKTKQGIIVAVRGEGTGSPRYLVSVQLYDSEGNKDGVPTKFIPLEDDDGFLAHNYGKPEDLVNRYWCTVAYKGSSVDRGRGKIIGSPIKDKETASKYNELRQTGAAYASPGAGMV